MTASKTLDIEHVLGQLTLDEKVKLLSGVDFWHMAPIERLGIPKIRMSDGPNGVRGTRFFNGTPAACLPNGTCLGATWDFDMIKRGGALQGEEALAKGASVVLGPTMNMQRSPLGGRGFESFSEDPVLSGRLGAATVQGMQSKGVSSTVKHYCCNDQEDQRFQVDSIVTERALREIYALPFQISELLAKPWCYMTAYNKVNGIHASENTHLLKDILRAEWGADTMVMSDWFGTYSADASVKAGLDLEMPGPPYSRSQVSHAMFCNKLTEYDIDLRVTEILKLINKVLPLGIPSDAPEKTIDTKETAAQLREIASSGIVLLKNDNQVLPFKKDKTIAVIGPNAKAKAYAGGGSASLAPYYVVTPLEGIKAQAASVKYAEGCSSWLSLPLISDVAKTPEGKPGLTMKCYDGPPSQKDRKELEEVHCDTTFMLMFDFLPKDLEPNGTWYGDITGVITPEKTGKYQFSLIVAGTAKLYVDGKLVVDNATKQTQGEGFFGTGSIEEYGSIDLEAGKSYTITVEYGSLRTSELVQSGLQTQSGGLRIGFTAVVDEKTEIEAAVQLAKEVDQVVICAGLTSEWETEGHDRKTMDLPGLTDTLIPAILAANPNTAIVIQSGTPVTMPWARSAPSIVQAWYGGNETGNAIADVVFGGVNPSGKLPLTFPLRNEDNPAFLNYRSERGRTLYGEDVYVGYRFYEKTRKPVLFPFGHGLSYTTFALSHLAVTEFAQPGVSADNPHGDPLLVVAVDVTNTGAHGSHPPGAEVVQVYVAPRNPSINRPVKELKGFAKTAVLASGATQRVEIPVIKKYAASFWDEGRDSWVEEKDVYDVLVGTSSQEGSQKFLRAEFEVEKTRWWNGL